MTQPINLLHIIEDWNHVLFNNYIDYPNNTNPYCTDLYINGTRVINYCAVNVGIFRTYTLYFCGKYDSNNPEVPLDTALIDVSSAFLISGTSLLVIEDSSKYPYGCTTCNSFLSYQ